MSVRHAFRFCLSFAATALIAGAAFAITLPDAKQQGLVGETMSGYIAPVGPASAEVSTLIGDINAKRKEAYRNISKENGQPLNVVEKLAAEKLYSRLRAGEYYRNAQGQWQQQ